MSNPSKGQGRRLSAHHRMKGQEGAPSGKGEGEKRQKQTQLQVQVQTKVKVEAKAKENSPQSNSPQS
jgi:hypothetical protein